MRKLGKFQNFQRLCKKFLHLLNEAQQLRPKKSRMIGSEVEWMIYERETMWKAVNSIRLQRGRPAVSVEEVERVENQAVGHIDYSQKFALYCAKLALEH